MHVEKKQLKNSHSFLFCKLSCHIKGNPLEGKPQELSVCLFCTTQPASNVTCRKQTDNGSVESQCTGQWTLN